MLMNPSKQKRSGSPTSEIKLDDLTELDNMDLNETKTPLKEARNNFLFSEMISKKMISKQILLN